MDAAPYGGLTVLADTSVWTNLRRKHAPQSARDEFGRALALGRVRSSPVVRWELSMARVTFEIEEAERRLSIARELPITKKVTDTMFSVLREMAAMSHGGHRVKPGDVLIAPSHRGSAGASRRSPHIMRASGKLARSNPAEISRWTGTRSSP